MSIFQGHCFIAFYRDEETLDVISKMRELSFCSEFKGYVRFSEENF